MPNFFQLFLNSFITISRKEVVRILRIWKQTLLPPVITQILYFLIFGAFIGSQIPGYEEIGGYMAFIVPGLVMMSVINNSFQNVVASFYGAKFQRNIEELLISPTPNWIILAGYIFGGIFRGLTVGAIVLAISSIFVRPQIDNIFIVFGFAFLTASLFALAGFFNSLFAKSFDDVTIIPTFVLVPLTYLGGVFYSLDRLPEFWQNVSKFNPIIYMIDGFRYGFYSINDFNIWTSFSVLLGLNIAFGILDYYLLKKVTA